jgi:hypothetical protein
MTRHRALTEQAADAAIDSACRLLRLPTIRGCRLVMIPRVSADTHAVVRRLAGRNPPSRVASGG